MIFKKTAKAIAIACLMSTSMASFAQSINIDNVATHSDTLSSNVAMQLPKIYATMDHPKVVEIVKGGETGINSVFLANGDHLIFSDDSAIVVLNIRNQMNVIDLSKGVNVTEAIRSKQVQRVIDKYEPMYTVPAIGEEKARIFVAKDPQCGYCNKLEREIPSLSAAGIAVEMYPLAVFPGSVEAMKQAACSPEPSKTYELLGQNIRPLGSQLDNKAEEMGVDLVSRDAENVVMNALVADYAKSQGLYTENCEYPVDDIARDFNAASLSGTPAIFTNKGQLIRGYVEAQVLINAVK